MIIKNYGDSALLIELGNAINPFIHQQVLTMDKYLHEHASEYVIYTIPAYSSLTVVYDASLGAKDILMDILHRINIENVDISSNKTVRKLKIPVCYDPVYGLDFTFLVEQKMMSDAELITAHTATNYHVYMIGFLPGFPYMGELPSELEVARKEFPRSKVPKGSVGLAGKQTGIYPSDSPGGWQIIGRTPIDIFHYSDADPFLFNQGDRVRFYPINRDEFQFIAAEQKANRFDITSLIDEYA
jgi:inhibitor of KinA